MYQLELKTKFYPLEHSLFKNIFLKINRFRHFQPTVIYTLTFCSLCTSLLIPISSFSYSILASTTDKMVKNNLPSLSPSFLLSSLPPKFSPDLLREAKAEMQGGGKSHSTGETSYALINHPLLWRSCVD